jgi:hypothetical protein
MKKRSPAKKSVQEKKAEKKVAQKREVVKRPVPVKRKAPAKKPGAAKKPVPVKRKAPAKKPAAVKRKAPAKKPAAVKRKAPAKKPASRRKRSRGPKLPTRGIPLKLLSVSPLFKRTNTIHRIYEGSLTERNQNTLDSEFPVGKSWLWFEYVDKETGEVKRASSIVSDDFDISMADLKAKAEKYNKAKVTNAGFQVILPGEEEQEEDRG